MSWKFWKAVTPLFRRAPQALPRFTVVMTTQCRDRIAKQLCDSIQRRHEGIIYFVGLTTGTTTLALAGVPPRAMSTPGSVDVTAVEIGKVVRTAADCDLQIVGQLHTHPRDSRHSPGDLVGMRIRHPGYFSIVVPNYGAQLPSFQDAHILMWTPDGYQEVLHPIKFFAGLGS